MAKKLSGLLSDIKTLEQVTLQRLVKLQQQLGMSGKSVNNYMSLLRKLWKIKSTTLSRIYAQWNIQKL